MKTFRETLWFKKGYEDAEAAARIEADDGGEENPAAVVDTLPIEDRYLDDGSLQPADSLQFGVHTGATQGIRLFSRDESAESAVDERVLVREMKHSPKLIAAVAMATACAIGSLLLFV